MSLLDVKQHKPNPFEIRRQIFFKIIKDNTVLRRSRVIDKMGVTPDRFAREYKLYLESYDGIIKYDEKTHSFSISAGIPDIILQTTLPETGVYLPMFEQKLIKRYLTSLNIL